MTRFHFILAIAVAAIIALIWPSASAEDAAAKDLKRRYKSLMESPKPADKVEGINLLGSGAPDEWAIKELGKILEGQTQDKTITDAMMEAAVKSLLTHVKEEYASQLFKIVKKIEKACHRAEVIKALWPLKDQKVFEFILDMLSVKTSDPQLGDQMWPVRMTVAELLANTYQEKGVEAAKKAVDAMLAWLPKEPDGRTKKYIRASLWMLIRRDYIEDMAKWQAYWKDLRDRYEGPPEKEEGDKREVKLGADGKADLTTALEEPPPLDDPAAKKPTFFGQEIGKKRLAFVIDRTGSMGEGSSGGCKMDVVKRELEKTITSFDNSFRFNMYFYNTVCLQWKNELVVATPEIKQEAIAFVKALQPSGMTDICGALKRASDNADVQTFFLLSDGLPTAGIGVPTSPNGGPNIEAMLQNIKSWNKFKKIIINTIGMAGCDANLLQKIASENGGSFSNAN
jgi:hypothetical protein